MLSCKQMCVLGVIIIAVLASGLLVLSTYPAITQVPAHRNFTAGDTYEYQISLVSNRSNTTYAMTETVLSSQPDTIRLEIFRNSDKFSDGDKKFLVDIDPDGTIISTTSPAPIIPEMQPELPGLLVPSPGNWVLQKEGIYAVNDTEIQYYAAASGNNEYTGMQQVSVAAGIFGCIVVKSTARFNFTQILHGAGGNSSFITRGDITGTSWIDASTGTVIRSDHSLSKVVATEQHELYQNKGIAVDQVYREIPGKSRITSELVGAGILPRVRAAGILLAK